MGHSILRCVLLLFVSIIKLVQCGSGMPCVYDTAVYNWNASSRVPTNCSTITQNCTRSWRSGVPQGSTSRMPLVYEEFTLCHLERGFSLCGFVSISEADGLVVDEMEGVVIGPEADLGEFGRDSLTQRLGVDSRLITKLEPYLGLRGNDSACTVIGQPLTLTVAEADALTDAVFDANLDRAEDWYEKIRFKDRPTSSFASLSRGIRTALVDFWFQFDSPLEVEYLPRFWFYVAKNDWRKAANELRTILRLSTTPGINRFRLNDVADIIEATISECSRPSDIVFLLDESGSISSSDFSLAVDFISNIIDSFDNIGRGAQQTRFGLSLFSTDYRSFFYLNTYPSEDDYLSALGGVSQQQGSTHLGLALDELFSDQLTEANGLRPEEDGIQRIVIVLTDGLSQDSVSSPAANIRNNRNTAIYAIGIGNYDLDQLNSIASEPIQFHTLLLDNFNELDNFIGDLVASTCNEPRQVPQNVLVSGSVKQGSTQFYVFNVSVNGNLEIAVNDVDGHTIVYASTENPHPTEFDNDFSFQSSSSDTKTIVISDKFFSRDQIASNSMLLFLSIAPVGSTASYTVQSLRCNPSDCSIGTFETNQLNSDDCSVY